jgi:hypothetical protein
MKRKRFSVEQIVAVLKQAELGLPVAELTRQVEGSRSRPFIVGSSSTGAFSQIKCASSRCCRMRTRG